MTQAGFEQDRSPRHAAPTLGETTVPVPVLREALSSAEAPRVIDVRTPAEYLGGHIEGSTNVPLATIQKDPQTAAARLDGAAILVCRTDNRARQALSALAPHAEHPLHVLTGGVTAWTDHGLPVEADVRSGQVWAMDRQVRGVAGALVLAGIAASLVSPRAKYLSGAIGAGLLFSAITDTCAMASLLGRLPFNQPRA